MNAPVLSILPLVFKAFLAAQVERIRALARRLDGIFPHLFPYLKGRHCGSRIGHFRKRCSMACLRAGCLGMLRYDFRRTAVRNMVKAGVPEHVAMTATGHGRRSVFDHYHIISPADLQEVARKLAGTI